LKGLVENIFLIVFGGLRYKYTLTIKLLTIAIVQPPEVPEI